MQEIQLPCWIMLCGKASLNEGKSVFVYLTQVVEGWSHTFNINILEPARRV